MQMAAHRPQPGFRLLERLVFVFGEHAVRDEIARITDAIEIFADPVESLKIPQPAFAVLDVRFDEITALAVVHMASITFSELGSHEFLAAPGRDFLPEPL